MKCLNFLKNSRAFLFFLKIWFQYLECLTFFSLFKYIKFTKSSDKARDKFSYSKTTAAFPFLFHGSEKDRTRTVLLSVIRSLPTALISNSCFRNSPRSLVRDRTDHLNESDETLRTFGRNFRHLRSVNETLKSRERS